MTATNKVTIDIVIAIMTLITSALSLIDLNPAASVTGFLTGLAMFMAILSYVFEDKKREEADKKREEADKKRDLMLTDMCADIHDILLELKHLKETSLPNPANFGPPPPKYRLVNHVATATEVELPPPVLSVEIKEDFIIDDILEDLIDDISIECGEETTKKARTIFHYPTDVENELRKRNVK